MEEWRAASTGHCDDSWLCKLLQYGFPLQYMGYVPNATLVQNHPSAVQFPEHVDAYIQKELAEEAFLGPFAAHPFPISGHINPLMSRPKSNTNQRRIIVDLSYPPSAGINAKVYKGYVFGTFLQHRLPTVQQAIAYIRARDRNVLMAVIDLERAYRNFRGDPIDWPLSVIHHNQKILYRCSLALRGKDVFIICSESC